MTIRVTDKLVNAECNKNQYLTFRTLLFKMYPTSFCKLLNATEMMTTHFKRTCVCAVIVLSSSLVHAYSTNPVVNNYTDKRVIQKRDGCSTLHQQQMLLYLKYERILGPYQILPFRDGSITLWNYTPCILFDNVLFAKLF